MYRGVYGDVIRVNKYLHEQLWYRRDVCLRERHELCESEYNRIGRKRLLCVAID